VLAINWYSDGLRVRQPRFDSQQGQQMFINFIVSWPDVLPTEPPTQWVPVALSPGLMWLM
jgi:hypothetical protein